jgi:hypothetical protein
MQLLTQAVAVEVEAQQHLVQIIELVVTAVLV